LDRSNTPQLAKPIVIWMMGKIEHVAVRRDLFLFIFISFSLPLPAHSSPSSPLNTPLKRAYLIRQARLFAPAGEIILRSRRLGP
jgi:hypothetical protein